MKAYVLTEALGELEGVGDLGDLVELLAVVDAETLEAVVVAPLAEVLLKGAATPIRHVTADLALVLDTETVKLRKNKIKIK